MHEGSLLHKGSFLLESNWKVLKMLDINKNLKNNSTNKITDQEKGLWLIAIVFF